MTENVEEEDKQVQTQREGESFQTVVPYTFDFYGLQSICAQARADRYYEGRAVS